MDQGGNTGSTPDPTSFEGRMLALLPSMRRYARSLTRSDSESEDLLQDSVERILVHRKSWTGTNLRSWAHTIMTNIYRNGLRQGRRFPSMEFDEASGMPSAEIPGDPLERDHIIKALDSLAPEYRAVLMLVVIEGYRYSEVADIMKVPIGTVMSRLSRARSQLGAILARNNVISLRRSE